ncbi:MAG TPA: hypothetical protein VIZ20_19180 [Streptosporangiaceae bacterium]
MSRTHETLLDPSRQHGAGAVVSGGPYRRVNQRAGHTRARWTPGWMHVPSIQPT